MLSNAHLRPLLQYLCHAVASKRGVRYQSIYAIKCSPEAFYARLLQYCLQYLCHAVALKREGHCHSESQAKKGQIYHMYQLIYAIKCSPEVFYACLQCFPQFLHHVVASKRKEGLRLMVSCTSRLLSFNVPSALHASPLGLVRSWLIATSSVSFAINFRLIPFY